MMKKKKKEIRKTVSDGYASVETCARIDCDLQVVRPGKFQCKGESDSLGCPFDESELISRITSHVDGVLNKRAK